MKQRFKTSPADTYCGSCVIDGEILYVPTANGIMRGQVSPPDVPSIIAFEKKTGRVLATDTAQIARRLLKGEWSSLSLGRCRAESDFLRRRRRALLRVRVADGGTRGAGRTEDAFGPTIAYRRSTRDYMACRR